MEITLKIEGMMCPHCEARVKKALEEVAGVGKVTVSYTTGTAVVVSDTLSRKELEDVVTSQGYKVVG